MKKTDILLKMNKIEALMAHQQLWGIFLKAFIYYSNILE